MKKGENKAQKGWNKSEKKKTKKNYIYIKHNTLMYKR